MSLSFDPENGPRRHQGNFETPDKVHRCCLAAHTVTELRRHASEIIGGSLLSSAPTVLNVVAPERPDTVTSFRELR
jgi:hypothetical protein